MYLWASSGKAISSAMIFFMLFECLVVNNEKGYLPHKVVNYSKLIIPKKH